jgi:hypothetical protein
MDGGKSASFALYECVRILFSGHKKYACSICLLRWRERKPVVVREKSTSPGSGDEFIQVRLFLKHDRNQFGCARLPMMDSMPHPVFRRYGPYGADQGQDQDECLDPQGQYPESLLRGIFKDDKCGSN